MGVFSVGKFSLGWTHSDMYKDWAFGVAKNFLTNAGVDLTGFDTEVLRQVENRLI